MKKALALLMAFAIASSWGAVAVTPTAALAADTVVANMPKTPNNLSLATVFNNIKANGSGSDWYRVSVSDSSYLKSTAIDGVTQHIWLLKVYYYSSNWGTVYGYIPYNQDFKTPKNFNNGYFSNGYPLSGLQMIDGVFSHDLEYKKYSWATGYKRHHMYDFFTGRDYTFEYFDFSNKPYYTSQKLTNDERILYMRSYWFNDGSGSNYLSRIDRKTGATITKTNILFASNQEVESGVLLNDHVLAFVSSKNGYKLYIIDLDNLNILNTVPLNGYSTIDTTSSPGSIVLRNGSNVIKIDVSEHTGVSPAQQAWAQVQIVEDLMKDLSTQPKIDAAQAALDTLKQQVQALPNGADKTQLEQKIAELQERIDLAQAELLVKAAESAATDLSANTAIDAAQTAHDAALPFVDRLGESPEKSALQQRLQAVQQAINAARATRAVELAETRITQNDTDAAHLLVYALPEGDVRSDLQARLAFVQQVIDATAEVLAAESAEQRLLDALANLNLSEKSDLSSLIELLAEVQAEIDKAAAAVNALQPTDKAALTARIAELHDRIESLGGMNTQFLALLEDAQYPNQGNGQERHQQGTELKVKPGVTISLPEAFGDVLQELGNNLYFLSFDPEKVSIDANGNATALQNGLHRVSVFSAKGTIDLYIHAVGNAK